MLATVCERLALGLVMVLPIIWSCLPHSRFVRTQFATALGLLVVALVWRWGHSTALDRALLLAACVVTLAGAAAWMLDPAPAGRTLIVVAAILIAAVLLRSALAGERSVWMFAGAISSSAFLGATLTAMLVGHSYLISPGLALRPLLRMLAALFVTAGIRAAVAGGALGCWLSERGGYNLTTEDRLWLPVRWLVGFAAPVGFGAMALSAARIRSTQSATGILYVAVVCAILGELLGLVLEETNRWPL